MKITKELIDRCWENSVLAGKTEGITPDIAWMDLQCEICELYQAIREDKRALEFSREYNISTNLVSLTNNSNQLRGREKYEALYKDTIEEELADCVIVLAVCCKLDKTAVIDVSCTDVYFIDDKEDVYWHLVRYTNTYRNLYSVILEIANYYNIDLEAEVNRKLEYNKLRYAK